jgi:hypothetical protein
LSLAIVLTAGASIPLFLLGLWLTNVHAGPGIDALFFLGVFLLWPLAVVEAIPGIGRSGLFWPFAFLLTVGWYFALMLAATLVWPNASNEKAGT